MHSIACRFAEFAVGPAPLSGRSSLSLLCLLHQPSFLIGVVVISLRESLISRFDLPGNFAFTLYMKYGMRETVVALLELHPINWLIILVLMWLNWARSAIKETHFDTGVTAEWGLFAAQAALLLIQFGVLIKCWLVYGKLTKLETVTSPSASKRETLLTSQVVDDFAHMPLSIMNEYELIHQLQEVRVRQKFSSKLIHIRLLTTPLLLAEKTGA
jgi:hypothetical protein